MHRLLTGVVASVAFLWSTAAQALPNAPFFATAEMTATVRSVDVGGRLLDASGNYVRDLGLSDLPILPWNVGDRLEVRWEQHSDDLQECLPTSTTFMFGGISFPTSGSVAGHCFATGPAVAAGVERANGGSSFVWDGWESVLGRGPVFDIVAGEVIPSFDPIDGLVVDCCVYLYDPDNDRIIGLEENGSQSPTIPSWPVHFLNASFGETEGGGIMELYTSQMFGYSEWEDPETGEVITLGRLEDAFFRVNFDVEWKSSFERLDVPEPGALALMGAGLLGASAVMRRRRRNGALV